jgi:hypothetical protein
METWDTSNHRHHGTVAEERAGEGYVIAINVALNNPARHSVRQEALQQRGFSAEQVYVISASPTRLTCTTHLIPRSLL